MVATQPLVLDAYFVCAVTIAAWIYGVLGLARMFEEKVAEGKRKAEQEQMEEEMEKAKK